MIIIHDLNNNTLNSKRSQNNKYCKVFSADVYQIENIYAALEALEIKRPPTGNISKEQIEEYINKIVKDYKSFLSTVSQESLLQEQVAFNKKWMIADRVLVQIRHIQHHVGYLNSVLRMKKGISAEWIGFNE